MKKSEAIFLIGGIIVVFCAPWYLGTINLRMMIEVLYYGLFAVSLCLMTGYGGKVSFGHAAYFGVGAYIAGLSLLHIENIGVISALMLAGLGAGILGAFFSIFLIRVTGTYYAMLTMAFGQLVHGVALKWRSVTGGDDGLGGFSVPPIHIPFFPSIDLSDTNNFYWFTMAVVGLLYLAVWHLTRTPFGTSIILLRENEERSQFLGHNTKTTRFFLFTVSSVIAGISGGLFALFQGFVSTSSVDIVKSLDCLMMMMIGGMNILLGPLAGSLFIVFVGDWLSQLTDTWEFYIGIVFILMMLFFRGGLVAIIQSVFSRLKTAFTENCEETQK
ncbi:MAG: branched-chain amino acid ABC transporter permease [Desulfobacula sp.]|jgi:branched-chain amino acid transport system permease protein